MRHWKTLGLLAVLVASCSSAKPGKYASEDEFTSESLEQIRKKYPEMAAEIMGPLQIKLVPKGEEERHLNLHRIFGYCNNVPEDCERARTELIEKSSKRPDEATLQRLRIMVRDQQYIDYVAGLQRDASRDLGTTAHYQKIGEDLYLFLAVDSPDAIALVGDTTIKNLGISVADAWAQAKANTVLPPLPTGKKLKKSAMAYQEYPYLSALLGDLKGWEKVSKEAGPDLFVTVVSDEFVFVGLLPDGQELDNFKKTVDDDCKQQQRCISPFVYRFRQGKWVIAR